MAIEEFHFLPDYTKLVSDETRTAFEGFGKEHLAGFLRGLPSNSLRLQLDHVDPDHVNILWGVDVNLGYSPTVVAVTYSLMNLRGKRNLYEQITIGAAVPDEDPSTRRVVSVSYENQNKGDILQPSQVAILHRIGEYTNVDKLRAVAQGDDFVLNSPDATAVFIDYSRFTTGRDKMDYVWPTNGPIHNNIPKVNAVWGKSNFGIIAAVDNFYFKSRVNAVFPAQLRYNEAKMQSVANLAYSR